MLKKKDNQLPLLEIKAKNKLQWLSHTAIEGVNRCKRCFWLAYKQKIRQPEGIQSRLASRFDVVFKHYFDKYRGLEILPPIITGKMEGKLQNPFKEAYFHKINEKYGFYGKLDECLVDNGLYIPIDFKTSSSDPREKPILDAYQNQIDEYVYLLQKNKYQVAGFGYLIFFYPDLTEDIKNGFPMVTQIVKIEAFPGKVQDRIDRAVKILDGSLPDSSHDCPFCNWFGKVRDYYIP